MKHKNNLRRFFLFLQLLIPLTVLLSCNSADNQDKPATVAVATNELKEVDAKKVLLLVADDRSGSTGNHTQPNRMTEQHYKDLLQVFIDKRYKGQFDVRVIGNPEHTGFEPPLIIEPLYQQMAIPTGAILSERATVIAKNKTIEEKNNATIARNEAAINNYIANTIHTKIIGYKAAGRDMTDIEHAFRDIEMKINNSAKMGYDKIYVVVMCDGADSQKSHNLKLKADTTFELILIGWPKDKKVVDGPETFLGSVDDLVNWIKEN